MAKYINVPVVLLKDFLNDRSQTLESMLIYSIYDLAYKKNGYRKIDRKKFIEQAYELNVEFYPSINQLENAWNLRYSIPSKTARFGLNLDIYFDYLHNHKTIFQDHSFLAFLALRSILGRKEYCKITNLFILSRMAGFSKCVKNYSDLPEDLKIYETRYHMDKLKTELSRYWRVTRYSRNSRGFYVSFKLDYQELGLKVEMKRKKNLLIQEQKEKDRLNKLIDQEVSKRIKEA